MALDSAQIERMLVEIVTGKKPTLRSPEADVMRAKLRLQVAEIEAKGGTVDIPWEIPSP